MGGGVSDSGAWERDGDVVWVKGIFCEMGDERLSWWVLEVKE